MAVGGSARHVAKRAPSEPLRVQPPRKSGGLKVVSARRIKAATQRRRARALLIAAGTFVVLAVFTIGMAQNMLGTQQVRLDNLRDELTAATQKNQDLLLKRAQLEAPARILQLAEHRLGMVTPKSVVYLTPVTTGPTVADSERGSSVAAH